MFTLVAEDFIMFSIRSCGYDINDPLPPPLPPPRVGLGVAWVVDVFIVLFGCYPFVFSCVLVSLQKISFE